MRVGAFFEPLPPPDVITTEIVEDLRAALEQFAEIQEILKDQMELKVRLGQDQIEAAKEIRLRLAYWQRADSALRKLSDALPGFDADATLLKVAAINTLYGTNLYAFARMARHITKVMKGRPQLAFPSLNASLACLLLKGGKPWRHWSFGSKFCHFSLMPKCSRSTTNGHSRLFGDISAAIGKSIPIGLTSRS